MNSLLRLNLVLLLAVAVFDPSDLLFHVKVPVFAGVWVLLVADLIISSSRRYRVPPDLYMYLYVFVIFLPLIGVLVYVFRGGGLQGYEGFDYYKSYLFLTLGIPLAIKRIDLVRPLAIVLSFLSVATVVLYVVTFNDDALRTQLSIFGDTYTLFSLTERTYGSLNYQLVYFHTSPLLAIAVAYFCYRSIFSQGKARAWNVLLFSLNVCAMLMSGTRNNMIVSMLLPLMIIAWYKGAKVRIIIGAAVAVILAIGLVSGVIQAMLSPDEVSNTIKLLYLRDYAAVFSSVPTLLFGQGLGASFFSTALGTRVSVTELTYIELLRNYGLIMACVFYALLLYPLRVLRNGEAQSDHYLFLAYLAYLYLCSANPLLMSSTGMLILAIVLVRTFSWPVQKTWPAVAVA